MQRDIPRADQAEQAVIGCLLLRGSPDEHAFDEIPNLKSQDFFLPECRLLFQACLELHYASSAVDQVLVAYHLKSQGKLDLLGNLNYFYRCLSQVETSYHLKFYAAIVLDASQRRAKLQQGLDLVQSAFAADTPQSPLKPTRKGIPFAK